MPNYTTPYAPSTPYRPDGSIAQLIAEAGRQAAEGQRRGGEIWGGTINNLGALAAGTIRDIAEGKALQKQQQLKAQADAPRIAQENEKRTLELEKLKKEQETQANENMKAEQLSALFQSGQSPDPNKIIAIMGPERGFSIVKGMAALQPDSEKQIERYRNQHELFRDAIGGLTATPQPLKQQAWTMARTGLIQKGLISEDMVPEQWSPEAESVAVNFGRAPEKHQGFSLGPNETRFDENGKPIARGVTPPIAPKESSFQAKDILDDSGKPVVANFNSKTGEYFGTDGVKIKNPKPVPSDRVAQDQQKFKKAAPVISAMSELSEKINTQEGLLAKMEGGARKLAAKANYDDDVAEYQSLISGFTPMVARALGHTGVLTQQDVDSVKALFPLPGDSKTLRDRKVTRLKSIISELESTGSGGADLATSPSAIPEKPKSKPRQLPDGTWTRE